MMRNMMMRNMMMAAETARFPPARACEVRHSVFIIRVCDPISHSRSAVPGGKGPLSTVMEGVYRQARCNSTVARKTLPCHHRPGPPVKHDLEGSSDAQAALCHARRPFGEMQCMPYHLTQCKTNSSPNSRRHASELNAHTDKRRHIPRWG